MVRNNMKYYSKVVFSCICLFCSAVVWAECPPNTYSCKLARSEKPHFTEKSKIVNNRQKTKVLGAQGTISNGVLYVTNQQINASSENNMVSSDNAKGVVIIEGGQDIKKIVISDLHIDARNIRSTTNKQDHALLVVNAPKNVDVEYVNSTINSQNVELSSSTKNKAITGGVNINHNGNGNRANVKDVKATLNASYFFAEVDN